MKRWTLAILILLIVAVGLLYLLIPSTIKIEQSTIIRVNVNGFSRMIVNDEKWRQWWPGETISTGSTERASFRFNGHTYTLLDKKLSSITLLIDKGAGSFVTQLFFLPVNADTVTINWQGQHAAPFSPVSRIQFYNQSKAIEKDLATILEKMKAFYSNEDNVYGIPIRRDNVTDSALISTSLVTKGYPSVKDIYGLVDQLKSFAARNDAEPTKPPMLNINTTDSITFTTKVAVPVNKKLKNEGAIQYRWMMNGGRILSAEVTGGPSTINKAFEQMENYITDFHRTAPAIPFQSLITDRSKEPDTSKWVTKLYWPVM